MPKGNAIQNNTAIFSDLDQVNISHDIACYKVGFVICKFYARNE